MAWSEIKLLRLKDDFAIVRNQAKKFWVYFNYSFLFKSYLCRENSLLGFENPHTRFEFMILIQISKHNFRFSVRLDVLPIKIVYNFTLVKTKFVSIV